MELIDLLIYLLDDKTGNEALGLLHKIQRIHETYNSDIDFAQFSIADLSLINTNDKIKNSIFLRYFPVPFVKRFIENPSKEEILNIYMSEDMKESTLIWTSDMRKLLHDTLEGHLKEFKNNLISFVKNKEPNFRKINNMPVYATPFSKVMKYPQIEKELRCAEYYLRVWNTKREKMENVHQIIFLNNLQSTFNEVTSKFPEVDLNYLQIIIKSYSLSYIR